MIVYDICGVRLSCDFSFFAVLALFFFFDSGSGLCAFFACIFHELGHLIVMTLCGVRVDSLSLYGGGMRLTSSLETQRWHIQLVVCSAGCGANLLLAAAAYCFGYYTAAAVNVLIAVLNLLPFGKLDGARIAELLLMRFAAPEKVRDILRLIKLVCAAFIVVILLRRGVQPDVTFIVFGIYLLFLDRLM